MWNTFAGNYGFKFKTPGLDRPALPLKSEIQTENDEQRVPDDILDDHPSPVHTVESLLGPINITEDVHTLITRNLPRCLARRKSGAYETEVHLDMAHNDPVGVASVTAWQWYLWVPPEDGGTLQYDYDRILPSSLGCRLRSGNTLGSNSCGPLLPLDEDDQAFQPLLQHLRRLCVRLSLPEKQSVHDICPLLFQPLPLLEGIENDELSEEYQTLRRLENVSSLRDQLSTAPTRGQVTLSRLPMLEMHHIVNTYMKSSVVFLTAGPMGLQLKGRLTRGAFDWRQQSPPSSRQQVLHIPSTAPDHFRDSTRCDLSLEDLLTGAIVDDNDNVGLRREAIDLLRADLRQTSPTSGRAVSTNRKVWPWSSLVTVARRPLSLLDPFSARPHLMDPGAGERKVLDHSWAPPPVPVSRYHRLKTLIDQHKGWYNDPLDPQVGFEDLMSCSLPPQPLSPLYPHPDGPPGSPSESTVPNDYRHVTLTTPIRTSTELNPHHLPHEISATKKLLNTSTATATLVMTAAEEVQESVQTALMVSERLLDDFPQLLAALHSTCNARCYDCALDGPIDIIVNHSTGVCLLSAAASEDKPSLVHFITLLSSQVYKFDTIAIVLYDKTARISQRSIAQQVKFFNSLRNFPNRIVVRSVMADRAGGTEMAVARIVQGLSHHSPPSPVCLQAALVLDRVWDADIGFRAHCEFMQLFPSMNYGFAAELLAWQPLRQLLITEPEEVERHWDSVARTSFTNWITLMRVQWNPLPAALIGMDMAETELRGRFLSLQRRRGSQEGGEHRLEWTSPPKRMRMTTHNLN